RQLPHRLLRKDKRLLPEDHQLVQGPVQLIRRKPPAKTTHLASDITEERSRAARTPAGAFFAFTGGKTGLKFLRAML
ncbi:MAG: hypothetical protein IIZ66_02510, partial [Clostridia bacterium]|nr:hypothetical protein [Clostridia bacterium]